MSWQRLRLRFWNTCNSASGMVRQGSTLKAAASALEPPASLNFAVSHREPDLEPGTICSEHRARLAVSIPALCCSWQRELLSHRLWLRGSDPLVSTMRLSLLPASRFSSRL